MRLHAAAFTALALAACSGNSTEGQGGGGTSTSSTTTSSTGSGGGGAAPASIEAQTKQGVVVGELAPGGKTRRFLGIPYAAPPTGDNRFRPPQPPAAWTDKRDATAYGPACSQFQSSLGGGAPQFDSTTSEDCLSLNVWAPATFDKPHPVMVWVHGGGWTTGAGSMEIYEGTRLSEAGGVVIVTLNYRLGPLGFAAHPGLTAEDPARPSSGNYGLLDQRAALQWVKENIAAFGGDPANVTLFGESAGGMSVCDQMASPGSDGLYHRALIESGFGTLLPLPTLAAFEKQGELLADTLGCKGTGAEVVSCLRGKTAQELIEALPLKKEVVFGGGVSWQPNIDGVVLPDQPWAAFQAGKEPKVPLLIGANADEGTLFVKGLGAHFPDAASLQGELAGILSDSIAAAIADRYGFATATDLDAVATQFMGDAFVCDARRTARAHQAAGGSVFLYHFSRAFAVPISGLGAFHSGELPFVWGNKYLFSSLSDTEKPLSAAMQGYWTRFAAGGDPNSGAPATAVTWPAYAAATDVHLGLDLTIAPGTGLRKDACDWMDKNLP